MNIDDLKLYLATKDYSKKRFSDSFLDLFIEYSKTKVTNFDEFENARDNFLNFFKENIDIMSQKFDNENSKKLIADAYIYSGLLPSKDKSQESFVEAVKNSTDKRNIHVLDVGPSSVPYSSVCLGKDFEKVSAMDDHFYISNESLKSLNVNPIEEYFTNDTNISNYDLIVGNCPCSAIDKIVYLCTKHDKKYLINTCDCMMPTIKNFYNSWGIDKEVEDEKETSHEERRWSEGWMNLLPELDGKIRSFGSYVYNVENNDALARFFENRRENAQVSREDKKFSDTKKDDFITITTSIKDFISESEWLESDDEMIS